MSPRLVLLLCLLSISVPSSAATLRIVPDRPWYVVGDTVNLTVIGDPEGASGDYAFAGFEFPTCFELLGVNQIVMDGWTGTDTYSEAGYVVAFRQYADPETPGAPLETQIALRPTLSGPWHMDFWMPNYFGAVVTPSAWEPPHTGTLPPHAIWLPVFGDPPTAEQLELMGLPVPEPGTGALLALGLSLAAIRARASDTTARPAQT